MNQIKSDQPLQNNSAPPSFQNYLLLHHLIILRQCKILRSVYSSLIILSNMSCNVYTEVAVRQRRVTVCSKVNIKVQLRWTSFSFTGIQTENKRNRNVSQELFFIVIALLKAKKKKKDKYKH